jgi:hypothetical protein
MHIHHIFFIHLLVGGHLSQFHILTTVSSTALNLGKQVFQLNVYLHSFRNMPSCGTVESYGSSIFCFLRNFHSYFQTGSTSRQYVRVPFSAFSQAFLFLMMDFLTGMRGNLKDILTCISFWVRMLNFFNVFLLKFSSCIC